MILSYSAIALWSVGLMTGWWLSLLLRERTSSPSRLPLPPGPRGYPVIGILLGMPTYKPWEVFDEWFKIYGDMIFFKLLGQPFLLLGSAERAYDIFEKRSSNYSDRPRLPMFNEMMDYTWETAFLRYGLEWKGHRRSLHEHFHPNIVHNYYSAQVTATRAFLRRLLKSPNDFVLHIRHTFSSTVLKLIYGLDILEGNNSNLIEISETVVAAVSEAGKPGAFLVDLFPWMKFIPAWLPGAGWKRKAQYWRKAGESLVHIPWNRVKEQLKEGTAQPSIAASFIEKLQHQTLPYFTSEERLARNTCAAAFAGGADTAVSTIQSFFMAVVLYPQVQKKAQEELDRVLGNRFPEFNDRPNLPYIDAMVKESLRWQPVAPLAAPHMATEADEYNGYCIPKGTIVIGNSWSILHDPKAYKDPLLYNPDRFMKNGKIDPSVRDPMVATFGYGRRICPGRFFAENSLFILICHLLTVYDIRPGLGDDGKELEIKPEMTDGLVSYPVPFACRITPRSEKAEVLIRNSSLID